jgi:lipid A ethanolaminephosphotransferase
MTGTPHENVLRWLDGIGRNIAISLRKRPNITLESLILLVSAYFVAATNAAFWKALSATGVLEGSRGWVLVPALAVAIIGFHAAVLAAFLNRWIAKPVLTILMVLTAAAAFFADRYGVHMDQSMIRNMFKTDAAEAVELFTPGLFGYVLMFGIVPTIAIWRAKIIVVPWRRAVVRRIIFVMSMLVLTSTAVLATFNDLSPLMRNHKALRYLITPGNYIISTAREIERQRRPKKSALHVVAPDAAQVAHAPGSKPHLLVIVVGETVRAKNWGLSGYARQTTPQLASLDVIDFQDVTACGSNTEVSVPCMFSPFGRKSYDQDRISASESLLHVLERAGVRTLWRDNQTGCKGVCDGLAFESYREPREDDHCDSQTCRDAVMLDGLHDAIDDNPGDVVVVLHQLGNHGPSYFKRYADQFRRFVPDCRSADLGSCSRQEIINAYDNAILATDDFLAQAIRMLADDASHDTAMIYISDHGESLGEANVYLHGLPYAIAPDTQIKVPLTAWLSEGMVESNGIDVSCVEARSRMPASHDNLFHSVLGLMQIQTNAYERDQDLFADCQRPPSSGRAELGPSAKQRPTD